MKKIAMGRVDVAGAHAWFRRASSLPEIGFLGQSQGNFWDFVKALVNLTLPSKSEEMVPHTFLFDEERLIKLRADMEDLINLEICMHMFRGLEANNRVQEARIMVHDDTPTFSATPSPHSRPTSPADETMIPLVTQLPSPHHFATKPKSITHERGQFRRDPSGQQVWVPVVEHNGGVYSPSPRSSPSSTASTPNSRCPTPLYLSPPQTDTAAQLRMALLAILASSTSGDKWTSLAPSLALQILRSTTTPLTALPQFEYHLAFHLSKPSSNFYQEAEQHILAQLFPFLNKLVETYTPFTSVQIFEAATSPKIPPGAALGGVKEEIEDVATRIAHIGMLHWRVWAPLAYLVDPEEQRDERATQQGKTM